MARVFTGASIVATYYLGRAFWHNQPERAAANTSKARAGEGTRRPEAGA